MAGVLLGIGRVAGGFLLKKGAGFLARHFGTVATGSYIGLQYAPETRKTVESAIDTVRGAFSEKGAPPPETTLNYKDNAKFVAKEAFNAALGGDPGKDDIGDILNRLFTGDNPAGYSAIAGFLSWCMGSGVWGSLFTSVATYFVTPLVKEYLSQGQPEAQETKAAASAEKKPEEQNKPDDVPENKASAPLAPVPAN